VSGTDKEHIMKRNMSNLDRIVRVVLGGGLVAAGLASGGVPGIVLYLLAAIMFATAVVSFCPLYRLLGIDTCKLSKTCAQ
jgi:uncharacterized membrane protein